MKTIGSAVKTLAVALAMFSLASGVRAEHDGDGITHDIDEVLEVDGGEGIPGEDVTGVEVELVPAPGDDVAGGEEPAGEETPLEYGAGEEIYYTMVDDGVVDTGADGDAGVTAVVDADGDFVYVVVGEDGAMDGADMEATPLMYATGSAGVITVSDTTADQAGVDSGMQIELDMAGSQASLATPVDVATASGGFTSAPAHGGVATRISGGHLSTSGSR
jgi:hypothetical protein